MKLPFSKRTEFVIKRWMREDAGGLEGRQLTPELRAHLADLLRENDKAKERGK